MFSSVFVAKHINPLILDISQGSTSGQSGVLDLWQSWKSISHYSQTNSEGAAGTRDAHPV